VSRRLTPRRAAGAAARRMPRAPFRFLLPLGLWRPLYRFWLSVLAAQPDRRKAVRDVLALYDDTYAAVDRAAIAYDDGVHAKHRLTRYHDFFVERVRPEERVLDVGAGKGELAYDLVVRAGAFVVGIDHDPSHLAFARSHFAHERLRFEGGDALERLPGGSFDVVVLSNVLEHIDDRVALLRRVVAEAQPRVVLLRVPVLARDWTVPLRAEVGLPHFSDPDHEVEYDPESFRAELAAAGLVVTELVLVWGEIWAAAEPAR
jgi:SAM-dependent methyltransferase